VNQRVGNSDEHISVPVIVPIRDTFIISYKDSLVSRSTLGILPNSNLKPEYGWTAEIGFQQKFGTKKSKHYVGLFDGAFFWQEYKNIVEPTTTGSVDGSNAGFATLPNDYTYGIQDQGTHVFSLAFNSKRSTFFSFNNT